MKIQLNAKGSRTLEITEANFETIRRYSLLSNLINSSGYVDEAALDRLKLNLRSLIAHTETDATDLVDLCIDVVYHDHMKAFGLAHLVEAYQEWLSAAPDEEQSS